MPRSMDPLVLGRVIGDILDPFTSSVSLRIVYNNNTEAINCGELKPSQIVNQPRVEVGGHDFRTFYTLIMVDPDAPSPCDPNQREYLHWLVSNIPATTGPSFDVIMHFVAPIGQEIVNYESPRPISGIHRITFVMFRQLCRQTVDAPRCRTNFKTREFAELHNLGLPVAAVYFNCQRESGWGGRRM